MGHMALRRALEWQFGPAVSRTEPRSAGFRPQPEGSGARMPVRESGTIPCTPARCLRLVRQPDINWCVPVCVQMVLGFYNKATDLQDVACALKLLGTDCSGSAMDFPAGREQLVVDVMQGYESRLKVEVKSPGAGVDFWTLIKDQIDTEAPVILFN